MGPKSQADDCVHTKTTSPFFKFLDQGLLLPNFTSASPGPLLCSSQIGLGSREKMHVPLFGLCKDHKLECAINVLCWRNLACREREREGEEREIFSVLIRAGKETQPKRSLGTNSNQQEETQIVIKRKTHPARSLESDK